MKIKLLSINLVCSMQSLIDLKRFILRNLLKNRKMVV